jgi:glycosyltransferase involved in cell wall biosynthesis
MRPKVSVLTTLYNKGAFVEEAVRSVLASSFTDFELIVVDDASTDGGAEAVAAIADPRIKLLRSQRNMGRPKAANRGMEAAQGEYLAVLDADDRMAPDRLAKQVAFLDAHPEVGAVGSRLPAFGGDGRTFAMPSDDAACRALSLFGAPVSYGAAMFRASVIRAHRLRCDADWLTPGMDYLFVLKVGAVSAYANIQEPLTFYRVGEQNMRYGRDPWRDGLLLAAEVLRRAGLPSDERSARAHLILSGTLPTQLSPADARAAMRWAKHLARWCGETACCPMPAFAAELEKREQWLFHNALHQRPLAAAALMLMPAQWRRQRLLPWAAALAKRLRS